MDQCWLYHLATKKWEAMPPLFTARRYHRSVSLGDGVYVVGGMDAANNDTPEVCSFGAAVSLNNCIYLVGGDNRTCLKYAPASDSWTRLSRPKLNHGTAPAAVWRGSILLAGGVRSGKEDLSSVIEQFDPATDTWSVYNTTLKAPLWCHSLFNVDLYGV
ncbi:hypothetical protein NP493_775g01001 [Ridgeia piscesae]|uniref:Uncharacterized protein n=1 Tax=Ridgeia piscesae TaxID=27915 RepID=A0AAD9NPN4_RIDPI|nr:hypothetical protein NP493_775g01001 [Ridgeia piscesae]